MRVRVVGAAQVEGHGPLSPRDRIVLATLVAAGPGPVPADRVGDALYGGEPPATWRKVVQGSVARLRQILGARAIETTADGYRLAVGDADIDVRVFERLFSDAVELSEVGQPARAIPLLREALVLVQGEPLVDLERWPTGRSEGARLAELRRVAEERLADALLADGRDEEAARLGDVLVQREPLREQRWVSLAQALYRCDRQADALRAIDRARRLLRDELGVDPGPALVAIERRVLEHDPALASNGPRPVAVAVCPYKGLAAYELEDADAFFGREDDVDACTSRLLQTGILAVVGSSGSGKSSLARAGVAPVIRGRGQPVAIITPGADPVGRLAAAPREAALVVDQLEELFTATTEMADRFAFAEELARRAVRTPIVVTLRADFVASVSSIPPLAELVQSGMYLLGPMTETQLRAAITGPAIRAGFRLEPGLVDLVIRDVEGQAGALPLLSHALAETWARRDDRVLTVAGYRAGGGVHGAVAATAERVLDCLPPEGRRITRGLFLRLVTLSDAGAPVSHRLTRTDLVHDERHAEVIDALLTARLLSADADTVELTHEALGRAWPRLRTWLDEDRDGQRILQHLATSAVEWEHSERDDAELYRGGRLRTTEEWAASTQPDLTAVERDFLAASAARRQVEEDDLAHQAATQRRINRRLRRALIGAAALLVFAVSAGAVAYAQQREAERSAREASLQALVSNAVAVRSNRRDLSALLAIEASRLAPSAASESALFGTFTSSPGLVRSRLIAGLPPAGTEDGVQLPDGTLIASDWDCTTSLIDASTLEVSDLLGPVAPAEEEEGHCWLSVSTDGRNLATAFRPDGDRFREFGLLTVSDLEARTRRFAPVELPLHPGSVSISAHGTLVAVAGGIDARSRVYDAATGALVYEIEPIPRPDDAMLVVNTVAVRFHPDGRLIVTSQAGPIRLLDGPTGRELQRIDGPQETSEWRTSLSPDGRSLITVGARGVMHYDLLTGEALWPAPYFSDFRLNSIGHAERNGLLVVAYQSGRVDAVDLATGVTVGRRYDAEHGGSCGVVVSPDGRTLTVTSCSMQDTESVVQWRLDGSGAVSHIVPGFEGEHAVVDYYDEPGDADDVAVFVEPVGEVERLGRPVTQLVEPARGTVLASVTGMFGPQPTGEQGVVLARFDDGTGGRYDMDTDSRVGAPTPAVEGLEVLGAARDGHRVLVWGFINDGDAGIADTVVRPVHSATASWVEPFMTFPHQWIEDAAVSGPGRLVLATSTTSSAGQLQLWDTTAGVKVAEVEVGYTALAAANGVLIASDIEGGIVQLDAARLVPVGSAFPSVTGRVQQLALSDDGRRLMVLGDDATLRFYDVESRTQLGDEIDVRASDGGGALRGDGLEAAVGTDQGVVIWDLDPGHWVDAACDIAGRNLTRAEWDRYIGDLAPYEATCPQFTTA